MDAHISRALYIGVAILLFMLAFVLFLNGYTANERFLALAMQDKSSTDPAVRADQKGFAVTGAEVTSTILEKLRQEEQSLLNSLYGQVQGEPVPKLVLPDITVDGRHYQEVPLSSIALDAEYIPHYSFDENKRVIRMDFTKR